MLTTWNFRNFEAFSQLRSTQAIREFDFLSVGDFKSVEINASIFWANYCFLFFLKKIKPTALVPQLSLQNK